ncbi:phage tail tape measure protein [Aeribacillus pallidus]|nr:phage tail tape measure protein [Aeribacillus pallidus]
MADKAKNVVLNFKMDGQVQYAKTLREINAIMNTAAKEYKNHVAAMGDDVKATDKLVAEKKKLEIQMEAARKRTEMLRTQYDAMSKDTKTTTGQLVQMYSKLLDAERAEMSLQKSLDRVNEGLSDEAQEARNAKEVLNQLQNESKTLDAEQKNLISSFKLQNAQLGENASEAEKTELAQKQLSAQIELTNRVVNNLERQLEQAKKIYGENSVEVKQLETKINQAKTEIAEFGNKLEGIKSSGNKAEQGIEGINKKLSAAVFLEASEQLQGISDKLLDIGKNAMDSAMQFGDSQTYLQANLGITGKEAEKLNGVVENVFKHGVVGSVEEAAEAVMLVKQQFGDLNDTDLEKLTNNITAIAKRTDTDVNENVRAAQQMMTAFGISGEEAMDLIAAGFQNGLNRSDDFLDTLNEYSPLFKDAGFSANQMLGILDAGMKNGAFNTDKVADAVKELQIRFGDGTFEEKMDIFSEGTQSLFRKWQDGKATMADVMSSIQKDIKKMDPTEQQAALTELGTQFEDLGVEGSLSLLEIGKGMDDVNGKAEEMSQKSPGEKWQSSLRELQTALKPIGENLISALTPVIDGLAKLSEWFSKLPGPVQTFITVFGGIIAVAAALTPLIMGVAAAFTALQIPLLPIIGIIAGVAAAIAGIILVIQNWGKITDWLSEKWTQFKDWIGGLWESIKELASTVFNAIGDFFTGWGQSISDFFANTWNSIKETFNTIISTIVNFVLERFNNLKNNISSIFETIKSVASNVWNGIKNTISNIVEGVKNTVSNIFNSLKSTVSNIWDGIKNAIVNPINTAKDLIKSAIDTIVGFFKGLGEKLKIDIPKPKLPHFKISGKFDLIPPDISVPKIDVDWYAKGGIFTRPTIFSTPTGYKGVGEAGPEAILPLNDETLGAIGRGIAATMNLKQASRPIVLQIGDKVFGQLVGDYADVEGAIRIRKVDRGLA